MLRMLTAGGALGCRREVRNRRYPPHQEAIQLHIFHNLLIPGFP